MLLGGMMVAMGDASFRYFNLNVAASLGSYIFFLYIINERNLYNKQTDTMGRIQLRTLLYKNGNLK